MPKKKIKDVTFEEINTWANRRACDGQWSMETAMVVIHCINEVNKHFFKKEKHWEDIKKQHFNLEAEIEVEDD